jgi:hypothetical protein
MRDKFLKEKRGTIKDFHHKLLFKSHLLFSIIEDNIK